MNKTRIIKKIIGTVLAEKGFKYIRCEKRIVWTFGRKVGDVEQEVYIQQHTIFDNEYKLMFWSSAKGCGMSEIGNILTEYKEKEYWGAETDDEFVTVIIFLRHLFVNMGLICWKICLQKSRIHLKLLNENSTSKNIEKNWQNIMTENTIFFL